MKCPPSIEKIFHPENDATYTCPGCERHLFANAPVDQDRLGPYTDEVELCEFCLHVFCMMCFVKSPCGKSPDKHHGMLPEEKPEHITRELYEKHPLRWWKDQVVVSTTVILNGIAVLPIGTRFQVTDKQGGFSLRSLGCDKCGIKVIITRVSPTNLALVSKGTIIKEFCKAMRRVRKP